MKIIRPVTINDAAFASSNISEDDYAAWSGATTYALADRVIVVSTNYHKIFESVQGSNTNHNPVTDTTSTWWLFVGSTNKWRAFDNSPSLQTSFGSSIVMSLVPGERVDTVALMNISAASVTITQTDPVDGLVYNVTTSLVRTSGIQDWYAYFFEPVVRVVDFSVSNLYPYANSTIGITLTDSGSTVLLGECVLGLSRDLGFTQYGASVGIQDYSIKQADVWGNYTITQRAFSKRTDLTVWIDPEIVDEVEALLASYRATPVVYLGSDSYASTLVYGFYKDFSIDIAYPTFSVCTLSVEGLS